METMLQIAAFNSEKAIKPVCFNQICNCSFSTKFGTGKLGRISTGNLSQTSNRATTLALMCASVAIVINKLSHRLSDRVCNFCGQKVQNLFQLFNLVKNSTKDVSVQSPDRFKWQLPSSVPPSQRSPANRKVFRIGLHATASKSSVRKVLFFSVQVSINRKIIFFPFEKLPVIFIVVLKIPKWSLILVRILNEN
jgi:hypothetical protein